jgi:cysteine desulfurase
MRDAPTRQKKCLDIKQQALKAFTAIGAVINGSPEFSVAHTLNVSLPGVDSEAAMVGLKDQVALSNGSACTSTSYTRSHVLAAMRISETQADAALRFSWCHMTPPVDWARIASTVLNLLPRTDPRRARPASISQGVV